MTEAANSSFLIGREFTPHGGSVENIMSMEYLHLPISSLSTLRENNTQGDKSRHSAALVGAGAA